MAALPPPPNTNRRRGRAAGLCAVALGDLVAVAVAAMFLVLISADRTSTASGSRHRTGCDTATEIRIGQTRRTFHDPLTAAGAQTEAEDAPPSLTGRDRDALVALCRPLLDRDMFTEPALTRSIADELTITQAVAKQHHNNLYAKFGVPPSDSDHRATLANAALRRGAVSLSQLREPESR